MKVGDLVKEKYYTERIGTIIRLFPTTGPEYEECEVVFTNGQSVIAFTHHFWEVIDG